MRKWPRYLLVGSLLTFLTLCSGIKGDEEKNNPTSTDLSNLETRLEYARVLSYLKRYDDSIEEYQKLLQEQPDWIEIQVELAKVYYYKKEYEKAIEILAKIPPEKMTGELNVILGDIYMAQKNYAKAEEFYNTALRTIPENDAIKLKIAGMLSWQKRYEESLNIYRSLLERHPNDIQLRRKYAMVLLWSGKEAEAADELKKTLN